MGKHFTLLALALLLAPAFTSAEEPAAAAGAAFTDVPELTAGFRLLYEQRFPEGREKFSAWTSQNPDDPFGYAAQAASYLFEEFYRQNVLTSDFFLNEKKFLHGINGKPDPELMKGFEDAIAQTRKLAAQRLADKPNDPESYFALTLVAGMESDADMILKKQHLEALKRLKEGNEHAKILLAEQPDALDAYVAIGTANYIVGSLTVGTRMMLWFGGIHGDRKLGMAQVGKTAEKGRYLKPFAQIMLALAARREKQNELAQKLLRELSEEFPASPLFAAEYAKAMGRPIPAEMRP
jgi:hypothetical protein